MIPTAIANKIRCDFVNKIYEYLLCRTYSIDCCLDDAKLAYLRAKLAYFTDCDLTHEQECALTSLKLTDYYEDCSVSPEPTPCSAQGSVSLSFQSTASATYNVYLRNNSSNTAYAYFPLLSDTIYQPARIYALYTDSPTINLTAGIFSVPAPYTLVDSELITSGSQLVGGVTLVTLDALNVFGTTSIQIPGAHLVTGYIRELKLHYTTSAGTYIGDNVSIDISPATSPYLSCPGCTTVTGTDLYFTSAN